VIDSILSSWSADGNYPRILVAVGSSHGVVNQFAAERNTQELSIRYVSGLRNQKFFSFNSLCELCNDPK
jgi:hypothetical protein